MGKVIHRLVKAMNAHDLSAAAALFHPDYRSSQPAHPGRTFTGREQMRANWAAMFAGIPDFRAELVRSVDEGQMTWSEWHWTGTRTDGQAFEMRGVTLFEIADDVIVAGGAPHLRPRGKRCVATCAMEIGLLAELAQESANPVGHEVSLIGLLVDY